MGRLLDLRQILIVFLSLLPPLLKSPELFMPTDAFSSIVAPCIIAAANKRQQFSPADKKSFMTFLHNDDCQAPPVTVRDLVCISPFRARMF